METASVERQEIIKYALILEPFSGGKIIIALHIDKALLEKIQTRLESGDYKHHVSFSIHPYNETLKNLVNRGEINIGNIDPNSVEEILSTHNK